MIVKYHTLSSTVEARDVIFPVKSHFIEYMINLGSFAFNMANFDRLSLR